MSKAKLLAAGGGGGGAALPMVRRSGSACGDGINASQAISGRSRRRVGAKWGHPQNDHEHVYKSPGKIGQAAVHYHDRALIYSWHLLAFPV